MAMLAEPRRKSKYRLQPFSGFSKINKRCDDDTSSFGFKLMASMGWAPGKGLGLNESGNVDPIKLRLKNDEAGLGYKVSEDDALAQQSEFQALLLQLNSGATDGEIQSEELKEESKKPKIKSLEKQSEQSSVRVHYKKFTRGKDLSRASEKDLRSILGLSSETLKVKKPEVKVPLSVTEDTTEASSANMYITAGSSVDYFKSRIHKKKIKKEPLEKEDAMTEDYAGSSVDNFESKIHQKKIKKESLEKEGAMTEDHGSKRRSVTWGDVDVSYVDKYIKDMVDTSGSLDQSLIDSECIEEPVKKKKKKKKNHQCQAEASEDNIAENDEEKTERKKSKKRKWNEEDISKKSLIQEQGDHSVPKKKKKRKVKLTDQDEQIVDINNDIHNSETEALCVEEPINSNVDLDEVPKQKKKKKKKKNQVSDLPHNTH